jgi:multidrug efflux pump subunit AcrA (membrane-fusion protein)
VKRKNRRILFVLSLLIAAGGIGAWLYWPRGNAGNNRPAMVNVVRRDLVSTVLATGAVKPQVGAEVRVGARISGKVECLFANIGDVVRKGQVIAQIEKADLEAIVNQRTAELKMAEAKLAAVESLRPREIEKAQADVDQWLATVELNRKELDRQEELLKQDFTSEQARDRAKEQLAVSEAHLASVRKALELASTGYEEDLRQGVADVERAKAVLANERVQLSYATVTAPIDGVIGSVSTQEGETVAAGLNAPTFVTIIDLNRLQVDTFVDEVDIGKIMPDQRAVFTVDSFPAREFEGKVVAIYPKAVIQENVVNYDVVVSITDPYDGLLRPEMTASVTISMEVRRNVLTLPIKAIKRDRGRSIVYLMSGGDPQPREVKIGWRDFQWVEILSGLDEGDTVLMESPPAELPKS